MIRMAVIAIIIALLLSACGGSSSGPTAAPPPIQSGWQFQYSPGMVAPIPDPAGGVYFDFPGQDGVHYLVMGRSAPLSGSIRANLEITMSAGATLVGPADPQNTCQQAPHFSFYIQRAGDNVTDASKRQWRWFSPYVTIAPGAQSPVVPLQWKSGGWIDVFGNGIGPGMMMSDTQIDAGFAAALAQPQSIGMTFGAGCFAGHGLFVTGGSARFHIRSFVVQ